MAFVNTLNSLSKTILPKENPVELTITNNTITIDPNSGSYFFLDDIDSNLTINISSLSASSKTIYLKLNFDEDDIVISWPNNIKWQEITSPSISQYEDLFISLMTLDGGTTWYSEPVIKTKPIVDCSNYMYNTHGVNMQLLTSFPNKDQQYMSKVLPTSTANFFNSLHLTGTSTNSSGSQLGDLVVGKRIVCEAIQTLDLSDWDTSKTVDMYCMFYDCSALTTLNISDWDVSNVINMRGMFYGCSSLTTLDISNWDIGINDMSYLSDMFNGCSSLTSLKLPQVNLTYISSDTSFNFYGPSTFEYCSSLTSLDLSNWVFGGSSCASIFGDCTSLQVVDLSNFNFENIYWGYGSGTTGMFRNCSDLLYIIFNNSTLKETPIHNGTRVNFLTNSISGFYNLPSNCKILVPQSVLSAYQSSSSWGNSDSNYTSRFDAIENYTITRSNGQITVTPNNS